jgi:hypothetical protein
VGTDEQATAGTARRRIIPAVAAVTVLVVAGGGAYGVSALHDGRDASAAPPKLRLTSVIESSAGAAADQAMPMRPGTLPGPYRLRGTLPAGPANAQVYSLPGIADEGQVRALASALGITGAVQKVADGWAAGAGMMRLHVSQGSGQSWTFSRGLSGRCAVAAPAPAPAQKPAEEKAPGTVAGAQAKLPGRSATATVPRPVDKPVPLPAPLASQVAPAPGAVPLPDPENPVDCAHWQNAPAASPAGAAAARKAARPSTSVTVNPVVGGRPTSGWPTVVWVSGQGIESASGWLGRPVAGNTYPVISAAAAFAQLQRQPRPAMGIMCARAMPGLRGGSADSPASGGPLLPKVRAGMRAPCPSAAGTVTGAAFGYSLQWQGDEPLLVPSWLFTLAGGWMPIAQVAIDPRYLAPPSAATPGANVPDATGGPASPLSGPGSPGSGSVGSGSVGSTGSGPSGTGSPGRLGGPNLPASIRPAAPAGG